MAGSFRVQVSDLDPGDSRRWVVDAPAEWSVDASRLAGNVTAELNLSAHPGGIMVTGAAEAPFAHTCNRCLDEFEDRVAATVRQDVVTEEGADYIVDGDELDTEPVLRDELLLAVPMVPVCRDGCKGLCPECGTDLNTGACSGHESEKASPFAELRSLFDQE